MSTAICSHCGTRNRADQPTCRRCRQALVPAAVSSGDTIRGTPTASLLNNRWTIVGPVPGATGQDLQLGLDPATNARILVRSLPEALEDDADARARFVADARALAQLEHPNLVRVLDVVERDERPCFVMERIDGEGLRDILARRGRLPRAVAFELGARMLAALAHLHEHGVVHGRLTPDTVLVRFDEGGAPHVTLVGVGLAGLRAAPAPYAAPELAGGRPTPKSDLYAAGIVLLEMLFGELPRELVEGLRAGTLDALGFATRYRVPDLSMPTVELLVALCAPTPDARPATAGEVHGVLQERLQRSPWSQMVHVPAGVFVRGSRKGAPEARDEEMPAAPVHLDAFFIDATPVTAAQFQAYLDATGTPAPPEWYEHNDPANRPLHPAVFVNWEEAAAYARWAGKRLPTEAEWEKAARGTDGRTYPWGNAAPAAKRAWYGGQSGPAPVGVHPAGASPFGALDMAGNVFEWVNDWFERDYYSHGPRHNPPGPLAGTRKVLRGGSFVHDAFALRCTTRGRYAPDERRANHSFRCVWTF